MAPLERQLLDRELTLLDAIQERIAETDRTVHRLGNGDLRVRRVRTIPGWGGSSPSSLSMTGGTSVFSTAALPPLFPLLPPPLQHA